MPVNEPLIVLNSEFVQRIFEIGLLIFAILYFFFSLIVIRQVYLMTDTLITEVSPVLRVLSILHAFVALGIVVFFITLI